VAPRGFLPSEDSTLPPVRRTLADYLTFCERALPFVTARNKLVAQCEFADSWQRLMPASLSQQ